MKFYVLIEWNGKGSFEAVRMSHDKKYVLSERECTYTVKQAKQKYYPNYFYQSDVRCSEIQIYKNEKHYNNGKEQINSLYYY
jgi:hypothetical protein